MIDLGTSDTNEYDDGKRFWNASKVSDSLQLAHTDPTWQIQYRISLLQRVVKIRRLLGKDNYAEGVIFRWDGESTRYGTNLTYAALKLSGRWWLTTVQSSPRGLSWDQFVAEHLTFALPNTIKLYAEAGQRLLLNDTEQQKLLNLQYPDE